MKKLLPLILSALLATASAIAAPAEQPACTTHGVDLLKDLPRTDPAAWEHIHAAAEAIPNGHTVFWKIEKDGVAPSWLLGTIHFSDPRVLHLPDKADAAYHAAKTVVIETTEVLDPKALLRIKLEQPELLLFPQGDGLAKHLPQDRLPQLSRALDAQGLYLGAVGRMKPWVLNSLLALPKCERERKSHGEKFLDEALAVNAMAAGRDVEGLETAAEQFEAIARVPLDIHMRSLVAALDHGGQIEDMMETLVSLYLRGDIGLADPALRKLSPDGLTDAEYDLFQRYVVTDRNRVMADRAVPILDKGGAFIAVGALHLPGKEGLVALLREKGFRLTAQ